eukprot:8707886-Ditylum_brightwellii.AAC.1
MVSDQQFKAKLQRSEIAYQTCNIARLLKLKSVAEKRENAIGCKTGKISELREALEWEQDEVKELKVEIEELKKMK